MHAFRVLRVSDILCLCMAPMDLKSLGWVEGPASEWKQCLGMIEQLYISLYLFWMTDFVICFHLNPYVQVAEDPNHETSM